MPTQPSHGNLNVMSSRTSLRRQRQGKIRLGVWVLISIVTFAFFVLSIVIFGQVNGEEFSPQRFTMRRFHYVQIPFLRWQVWPVTFTKVTGADDALANHIRRTTRTNNLMSNVRATPTRWDIISMEQVGAQTYRGDASILTNYLRQPGAKGMETWLDWSKANPGLAAELWGVVAQLAQKDLYPIIPEVLEAARRLDASGFRTQIRKIADQECRKFAKAFGESGDPQRAKEVTSFAQFIASAPSSTPSSEVEGEELPDENAESADVNQELP